MASLFHTLGVGAYSLFASRQGVDTAGHNIANANTPGYSRQRVNMAASDPISLLPGEMGTGVKAVEIQRIYNQYLRAFEKGVYLQQEKLEEAAQGKRVMVYSTPCALASGSVRPAQAISGSVKTTAGMAAGSTTTC